MNKSYYYIMGGSKFFNLFDFISGIIICTLFSFCLSELIFSFDFKIYPKKIIFFIGTLIICLVVFYFFLSQRRYRLLEQKLIYGIRKKTILYKDINTLIFTLSTTPRGIYDIGLTEPYFCTKKKGRKEYISNITVYTNEMKNIKEQYDTKIINGNLKNTPSYSFNCHDKLSIYHLIKESNSDVYVTRSFLVYNNWTINEFSRIYNIPTEKIQLINDMCKQ